MKEAAFYSIKDKDNECMLCPHQCLIPPGKVGRCKVRRHTHEKLYAENYGRISYLHLDPIEKKPLYHFFPGSYILSAGSFGCNLQCKFCQNSQISQCGLNDLPLIKETTPAQVVQQAMETPQNIGLAFTYNEPIVWYEFVLDAAKLACGNGLKTIMVTNGFIETDPLRNLLPWIDGFNVDLKAFTEDFYRNITFSCLSAVLTSLQVIRESGKHLEITFLIIPGLNDSREDFIHMLEWIRQTLGKDVPLHLSRYFPMHRMNKPPTPLDTMLDMHSIAQGYLDYVYLGNVSYQDQGRHTYCPSCHRLLIQREGNTVSIPGLTQGGDCQQCGYPVSVLFTS